MWYQQDREAVLAALRRGERPDLATTMVGGPLDELIAVHDQLGVLRVLDRLPVRRQRTGLADALYADGPLLAWSKYAQGIDALVALPADRRMYQDLQGLARGGVIRWSRHR